MSDSPHGHQKHAAKPLPNSWLTENTSCDLYLLMTGVMCNSDGYLTQATSGQKDSGRTRPQVTQGPDPHPLGPRPGRGLWCEPREGEELSVSDPSWELSIPRRQI